MRESLIQDCVPALERVRATGLSQGGSHPLAPTGGAPHSKGSVRAQEAPKAKKTCKDRHQMCWYKTRMNSLCRLGESCPRDLGVSAGGRRYQGNLKLATNGCSLAPRRPGSQSPCPAHSEAPGSAQLALGGHSPGLDLPLPSTSCVTRRCASLMTPRFPPR